MIITVRGNLIDTKYIYNISEVEGLDIHGDINKHIHFINEYVFKINFLNEKSITISLKFNIVSPKRNLLDLDENYINAKKNDEKLRLKQKMYLDELRNRVIDIWKGEQLEIPNFDINPEV